MSRTTAPISGQVLEEPGLKVQIAQGAALWVAGHARLEGSHELRVALDRRREFRGADEEHGAHQGVQERANPPLRDRRHLPPNVRVVIEVDRARGPGADQVHLQAGLREDERLGAGIDVEGLEERIQIAPGRAVFELDLPPFIRSSRRAMSLSFGVLR